MDMQPAFAMSDSSVDIIDLTVASEVDKVIASHVNKKNTEGFVSLDAKAEAPRHRDRKDEPLSPKSSGSGTSSQSRRSRDGMEEPVSDDNFKNALCEQDELTRTTNESCEDFDFADFPILCESANPSNMNHSTLQRQIESSSVLSHTETKDNKDKGKNAQSNEKQGGKPRFTRKWTHHFLGNLSELRLHRKTENNQLPPAPSPEGANHDYALRKRSKTESNSK